MQLVTQGAQIVAHVVDQERQCFEHARQVFARKTALHVLVRAHAHEYSVEIGEQGFERDIAADFGVQAELDAHVLHDGATASDDFFFQLEFRDAESEQAADFFVAVKHHRLDAIAHQNVSARQTRRPSADDGDLLAGRDHAGHIWTPARLEGFIADVFFDRADGHRAKTALAQRATAFAQAILRTNAAGDFRQAVGLVAQFRRFKELAFVDQLQPVRDEVVHRAFPRAVWVAAGKAATGLLGGVGGVQAGINFLEHDLAGGGVDLGARIAADIHELIHVFFGHLDYLVRREV